MCVFSVGQVPGERDQASFLDQCSVCVCVFSLLTIVSGPRRKRPSQLSRPVLSVCMCVFSLDYCLRSGPRRKRPGERDQASHLSRPVLGELAETNTRVESALNFRDYTREERAKVMFYCFFSYVSFS